MQTFRTVKSLDQCLKSYRHSGLRAGLVPTMDFLRDGHLALIKESVSWCDAIVASIFINPTQFGPNKDFNRYSRTLERDHELCRKAGVALIFVPDASEIDNVVLDLPPGEAEENRDSPTKASPTVSESIPSDVT